MTLPNQQSLKYSCLHGSDVAYSEPPATQVAVTLSTVVQFAASSVNNQVNLGTLFPALTSFAAVTIDDLGNTGFNVGTSSVDPREQIRPGAIKSSLIGAPVTYFIDNPSAIAPAQLQITVSGS